MPEIPLPPELAALAAEVQRMRAAGWEWAQIEGYYRGTEWEVIIGEIRRLVERGGGGREAAD